MNASRKPYRLLVTGSRTWRDEAVVRRTLQGIYDRIDGPEGILIHGTAMGLDSLASTIWMELGGAVEPHPADWDRWGKRAGYVRNAEMVATGADVCLAFIRNNSRGATMCAKLADKAGIPTLRIFDNDDNVNA